MIRILALAVHVGCCLPALALYHGAARAGGYDTGNRNWDLVFQDRQLTFEAEVRRTSPRRVLRNVQNANPFLPGPSSTARVRESADMTTKSAHLAVRPTDHFGCLASYHEPWDGDANYGTGWSGSFSAIEQNFSSADYGVTCAVNVNLGPGRAYVIGGVSQQEIEYELTRNSVSGLSHTKVTDESLAWRAGVAYDIKQYGMRASLIYNSQVDYNPRGSVSFATLPAAVPVSGSIALPQSLEVKIQSGVSENWLAYGSIKWTDWSVTDSMPLCAASAPICSQAAAISGLTLLWKDSWTVTVGLAHSFSDTVAIGGYVTWDQGATQGFTSQTDTWVAGLVTVLTPTDNVEVKLGGSAGLLTGGSLSTERLQDGIINPVGYTAKFDDDYVYTFSAAAKFRF